jgi:NAD-dependent DNA ligase
MFKVIIGLLVVGIILYMIFGIWGIIIPAVLFVGFIIVVIKNASKITQNTSNDKVSDNIGESSNASFSFDAEIDVGSIPINIKYKNNESITTIRDVDMHKIGITGNKFYIRGFCHNANEERTFKVERIIEATASGKSVNPMVFVSELCKNREEFDKGLLNGVNFCITGTLKIMTRRQAQERIEAYGGGFHKYIRYDTSFLVAENPERKTGKLTEAKAHGIPIIDEDTFIDYLSEPIKAQAAKPPVKDQYEYYKGSVKNDLDYKKTYAEPNIVNSTAPPQPDESQPLRGFSFCFAEEPSSMKFSEANERIRALGGWVKSSLTKNLSYLVANDPNSGKSKRARELGIPVINEKEFLSLLATAEAKHKR